MRPTSGFEFDMPALMHNSSGDKKSLPVIYDAANIDQGQVSFD